MKKKPNLQNYAVIKGDWSKMYPKPRQTQKRRTVEKRSKEEKAFDYLLRTT
jgi:hypothetical protein